jgi:hypothetical protein
MHDLLKHFCCVLLAVFSFMGNSIAQPSYPKDYFRNPLDIPIILAGNFGECRPGHFHSGIDIKTAGRENLPVFAAAEGYISRIKMEPGGFGHGLYITHPNGYTTLYAHLNNFTPAIQQYVRQEQYKKESWTVDLVMPPNQFPVKKGQQVAFSGNTGGSTAPHLHFEIRDTKTEHPLNPQLFGFSIPDTRPPVPLKLAVYDRSVSIYNDNPILFNLTRKGNYYQPAKDTILVYDQSGFGIEVNDFMNGSENTLAFYTAAWSVDEVPQGRIRLDDIGYDETRYLHAYADYKTKQVKKIWLQCLFRLPGNALNKIYEELNTDRGEIIMPDNEAHKLTITLTDVYGNQSLVRCWIKRGVTTSTPACNDLFTAGTANRSSHPNISYQLEPPALYDNVCQLFSTTGKEGLFSDIFQVGPAYAPVHTYFELQLKPGTPIPFDLRNKIALVYSDQKDQSGKAATPTEKGWYKASVRNLGQYWLVADTIAPTIRPATAWVKDQRKAKRLSFVVRDEITSVRSFRAELDGKWILFEQHGSNWFYEIDSRCPKGPHTLVVKATDENGNVSTATYSFER